MRQAAAPAAATRALIERAARAALDFLLPPRCPSCAAPVVTHGTFCAACFGQLNFITAPFCGGCGLPFPSEAQAGRARLCAGCAATPHAWNQARASLLYDDAARRLILPLKHADRQDIAPILAQGMARAGRSMLEQADMLVPVPLHRTRLLRRGFNQAALLAQSLSRQTGLPSAPDTLRRVRRTPTLGPLSAMARAEAVHNAFMLRAGRHAGLRGKRVVLVDDVMTSGATANACAATLRAAGAASVDVLVAARVPDPR